MPLRRRKVEETVQQLLASQKLDKPPVPVERIARLQGVRIFLQSLDNSISGFLYRDSNQAVIGINTHHPKVRQRFTLAHELGHFLLHQEEKVHVDHGFQIQLRDDLSSQGVDESEMEANLFAAELLMPKTFLEADLKRIRSLHIDDDAALANLARRYGVSMHALAIRLTALGYLDAKTEMSVYSTPRTRA